MPSVDHELLIQAFRDSPSFAAALLGDVLGLPVPPYKEARLESGEFTDSIPTEYRADAVVVLAADRPLLAVVVEVQLGRDPGKHWSWPVYLSTLRARKRCPAVLLVLCLDSPTANWCSTPIDLGHPDWVLKPMVVGPDMVPLVLDSDQAKQEPGLAMLSAIAHGNSPAGTKVVEAFYNALSALPEDQVPMYADYVLDKLHTVAARTLLEELMATGTYEYQSDFARRYYGEGKAEGEAEGKAAGKAEAVLTILEDRSVPVSEEARARIVTCTDLDQLDAWLHKVIKVSNADELFD